MSQVIEAMKDEDLYKAAPSIFANDSFLGMSDHYKFIPTIEIVTQMRQNGFFPIMASQSKTRCSAKQGFQKHMVKFRQQHHIGEPAVVGKEVPEILMVNSHDGSSLYELMMGIFRFICGNGMVVQSQDFGSYSVKHTGMIEDLLETTFKIVADFPKAFEQVDLMKGIILPVHKQLSLASAAIDIRNPEKDIVINPEALIIAKDLREDDMPDSDGNRSLWNTFNVIQENIIKGGIDSSRKEHTDKTRKARGIAAIQENLRVNKELWRLATRELIAA